MKKIRLFLVFIISAGISLVPAFAQEQEYISLDLTTDESFETVLSGQEEDDNPVSDEDEEIYKKRKHRFAPLIQAPKKSPDFSSNQESQIDSSGHFFLYNVLSKTAKDIYNLEIEKTNVPSQLLKDKLTFNFEKGPVEKLHLWSAYQMNFSETIPEKGSSTEAFDMNLVNVLIDGTFKGEKEDFRIMLDPLQRKNAPYMGSLFQDLYVETHRIKNTSILVGNSRVGVGMEGNQSPYTLSFVNRSQIARNFSNVRKFGVRVRGDYNLVDYDAGIYSSSTNFTSFFPGHEANVWLNIKPLGKTDGKYGRLITGGGLSSGEKHGTDYFVSGAYVGYDYKRFWVKAEYARANGSNGRAGLTNNRAQGFFATAGYFLTKKIELLARYDQFDPDRNIADNTRREYTIGSNYYLKGQALKLIFNYIYCQNENAVDSHRLMLGTQLLL